MSKGEIMNEIKKKKYNIKVVNPADHEQYISDNDIVAATGMSSRVCWS